MSQFEIKVPSVGESVTEGTLSEWLKKDGELVEMNQVLFVLETDKASMEVTAEKKGVLKHKVSAGDTVTVGQIVGVIDTSGIPKTSSFEPTKPAPAPKKEEKPSPPPEIKKEEPSPSLKDSSSFLESPTKTKEDYLKSLESPPPKRSSFFSDQKEIKKDSPFLPPLPPQADFPQEVVKKPMTRLRQTIAKRLVHSQQTAALLTTFNEINMKTVVELRKNFKEEFKQKYGVNLGFMGFFVKACVEALKAFPKVNASMEGTDILYKNFYNVGVAVGTEKGLFVPVIRNADKLSVADVEKSIKHYAIKARNGQIEMSDLADGTFTISNGGVYGSLLSTPIVNPPQSAILGLHKIEERPVAVDKRVEIHPMMYVALSYDHRLIDGSESVRFLGHIKECIENPSRIFLGV